ncbi:hypothetical protein AA0111_g987 [Alternaria arborescens]|uniref:hypothetical protein n=1 Tax=Alternaria arborescens TaxID=156630 RepID=UPI00107526B1|nr:hypothetical protein AA0111_g987 [Alternaria arborescens]RYO41035.1 hypothetical protein AA0111_g987 [Alternaria arborescens]
MNPKDPMVPIPYSLDAVEALCSYWNVPYNYVPRHEAPYTCNATFSPVIGDETWKGLVIYFTYNALLITYDSANHRTFGIYLPEVEADAKRIVRRIERLPNFAFNPLFAPVIIAGISVHDVVRQSAESFAAGIHMESAMGYWSSESESLVEKDLNFTQMIKSLNTLSIEVANTEYIQTKTICALDFLNELLLVWPKEPGALIGIELQEQVRWLLQLTRDWMAASKRTKDSVQSLTQTIYATLQQRDNQLNHRYGADMRLITAITLIFLPGTFVATFFSTTFWDFSPDNRGAKVTYWIYLYFVATIGLTFLVLFAWRKFSVLKRSAANMGQLVQRIPLLGRLMTKKRMDDEELGKKGD